MNRDARIRLVLFNLHLIGGLVAGLFLLILGVSGAVLAFSDEIDAFLQPSIFKVTAASSAASHNTACSQRRCRVAS